MTVTTSSDDNVFVRLIDVAQRVVDDQLKVMMTAERRLMLYELHMALNAARETRSVLVHVAGALCTASKLLAGERLVDDLPAHPAADALRALLAKITKLEHPCISCGSDDPPIFCMTCSTDMVRRASIGDAPRNLADVATIRNLRANILDLQAQLTANAHVSETAQWRPALNLSAEALRAERDRVGVTVPEGEDERGVRARVVRAAYLDGQIDMLEGIRPAVPRTDRASMLEEMLRMILHECEAIDASDAIAAVRTIARAGVANLGSEACSKSTDGGPCALERAHLGVCDSGWVDNGEPGRGAAELPRSLFVARAALRKLNDPDTLSLDATVFRNGGSSNGEMAVCYVREDVLRLHVAQARTETPFPAREREATNLSELDRLKSNDKELREKIAVLEKRASESEAEWAQIVSAQRRNAYTRAAHDIANWFRDNTGAADMPNERARQFSSTICGQLADAILKRFVHDTIASPTPPEAQTVSMPLESHQKLVRERDQAIELLIRLGHPMAAERVITNNAPEVSDLEKAVDIRVARLVRMLRVDLECTYARIGELWYASFDRESFGSCDGDSGRLLCERAAKVMGEDPNARTWQGEDVHDPKTSTPADCLHANPLCVFTDSSLMVRWCQLCGALKVDDGEWKPTIRFMTDCTPLSGWGCEARRKLGKARGALSDALEAPLEEVLSSSFRKKLSRAFEESAQPQLCPPPAEPVPARHANTYEAMPLHPGELAALRRLGDAVLAGRAEILPPSVSAWTAIVEAHEAWSETLKHDPVSSLHDQIPAPVYFSSGEVLWRLRNACERTTKETQAGLHVALKIFEERTLERVLQRTAIANMPAPEPTEADAAKKRLEELGRDRPWSPHDFVKVLADAATHLLRDHDCDAHGYEQVDAARDAALAWLADFGDCTETERTHAYDAFLKICNMTEHDSPIYVVAGEALSSLAHRQAVAPTPPTEPEVNP